MKKIFKKSYLLIGPAIFIWIIKDIEFIQFKQAISAMKPAYFIMAACMYVPITIIKSYRWKKIMDVQKIRYSAKETFLMSGASSLIGLATPGRLGDFSKIAYLKKDNHSTTSAFFGSLLDKIFDLIFVILFAAAAIPFLKLPFRPNFNYHFFVEFALLFSLAICAAVSFFYLRNKDKTKKIVSEILEDAKKFNVKKIIVILSVTAAVWSFYFLMIYLIAASIGLNQSVGFFYLAFSAALGILSALIPISILGIGAREASLLFLLTPVGISKETIILFSLLITTNYISLFAIYFYCWLKKPLI